MSLLNECAAVRPGINSRIPIWKSNLVIKILENLCMYQVLSHVKWRIEAKGIGEITKLCKDVLETHRTGVGGWQPFCLYLLCNLQQVILLLRTLVSPSVKYNNQHVINPS